MVSVVSSVFKLQSRLLLLLLVVVVVAVLPEYLGNVRKAALKAVQLLYNVGPGGGWGDLQYFYLLFAVKLIRQGPRNDSRDLMTS